MATTISDGDTITTIAAHAVTGEVTSVRRSSAWSPEIPYLRTLDYDSLGRLVRNMEPNTGNNWRYAWDDAGRMVGTSDARGCGENMYYDGLNRLVGEDYSPCHEMHPDWSAPDLSTGAGLESSYTYDTYEPDQLVSEPGFIDDARYASGKLVASRDRGSYTRFNYDAHGRVRRSARQIAKPDTFSTAGSRYGAHWFSQRTDYDLGGRVKARSTGADIPEFLVGGGSAETYKYSGRGNTIRAASSYGILVRSAAYDPDGATKLVQYWDEAATKADFEYDERRRLKRYHVSRQPSPYWTTPNPPATYPLPDSSTKQTDLTDLRYGYDSVGNPQFIRDDSTSAWPVHAAPVKVKELHYDGLYRLISAKNTYATASGGASWLSPYAAEVAAGDVRPVPLVASANRIREQSFSYDFMGNLTSSFDDTFSVPYDRSLGANLTYGTTIDGPNQLRSTHQVQNRYDSSGNLIEVKLDRGGSCPDGTGDHCVQWFAYDWDEVGQLSNARRWDFEWGALPGVTPTTPPAWHLKYAYSGGSRVLKSAQGNAGGWLHSLDIFSTLRLDHTQFDEVSELYVRDPAAMHVYVGGVGHVFYDANDSLPRLTGSRLVLHVQIGDHLGSSSIAINHGTGELVERTTYQPYGAIESDYRPARWASFREDYKFTGKSEDIEVGATYFGARYYNAHLGRFMSPDPLTVHGLGGDINPYAYVGGRVTTHVDPWGLDGTDVTSTQWCAPGYCDGDTPPVPNDHGMAASRGEAAADGAGSRRLERLSRGDSLSGSAGTGRGGRGNFFGIDPEAADTPRQADGTPEPGWERGRSWFAAGFITYVLVRSGVGVVALADDAAAALLLRMAANGGGAAVATGVGAAAGGGGGCSTSGNGCAAPTMRVVVVSADKFRYIFGLASGRDHNLSRLLKMRSSLRGLALLTAKRPG